jgi:ribosomal protein S18 acetylase RimI-like enzyme
MTATDFQPVVRRATASDVEALGRLGALLVQEHHDFDGHRFLAPGSQTGAKYASFLGFQLAAANAVVLVAEHGGGVVGYAYASVEGYDYMSLRGPAGVLQDLIVDPDYRGRGVGCLLLRAALSSLRARGVPRVVLSTAAQNEKAQRLFERIGFRRTMVEMTCELHDAPRREGEPGD